VVASRLVGIAFEKFLGPYFTQQQIVAPLKIGINFGNLVLVVVVTI
jgi:hypothetical protein